MPMIAVDWPWQNMRHRMPDRLVRSIRTARPCRVARTGAAPASHGMEPPLSLFGEECPMKPINPKFSAATADANARFLATIIDTGRCPDYDADMVNDEAKDVEVRHSRACLDRDRA